jgi:hypothetical protein
LIPAASLKVSFPAIHSAMSTENGDNNNTAWAVEKLHQPWKRSDLWPVDDDQEESMVKKNQKLTAIEIISAAASGPVAGQGITVKLFYE